MLINRSSIFASTRDARVEAVLQSGLPVNSLHWLTASVCPTLYFT